MIKLAFYKAKGKWRNRLIRIWTRGPYSHCEVLLNESNGRCVSSSEMDDGVRYKFIQLHPDHWDIVDVTGTTLKQITRFADPLVKAQLKYDWLGILLSQVLPLARHSKNKWFCSEFCAAAIGLPKPQKYSPNSLHRYISARSSAST